MNRSNILANLALIFVAVIWGLNFVVFKLALEGITPYLLLGLRFAVASIVMVLVFRKQLKKMTKADLKAGLLIGLVMTMGYITQTVGLVYTTPAKSGFITGSGVVMVPFIAFAISKVFPGWFQILGAVLTFCGIGVISLTGAVTINPGDVLTLICAVFFALQTVFTEQHVKKANPINIAVIQTILAAVVNMVLAVFTKSTFQALDLKIAGAIVFTAVLGTAGCFVIQNIAQKYTSATNTAVILSTESIFAGVFSYLILNETLTPNSLWGFALIAAGLLISQLRSSTERRLVGVEHSTT